ncbi:MAG TPA: dihydrolipoamide acetyltransferase family protein [Polyangiaceae bacterium]|nr:dihydrolipoamide acetyltransferase family protein [Polyangiaceae bacterium]
MPSLGADMDAGTLVEWKIAPGDKVVRGSIVALVETQKGLVEVEIWQEGVVDSLVVKPGTKVPVGTVLATLRDGAGAQAAPAPAPAPVAAPQVAAAPVVPPPVALPPPAPDSHVRASPAARQRARELGVDLASTRGTGPHAAITLADVENAARPAVAAAPAEVPVEPTRATSMRQAIAATMARSKREIPHYYLSLDCDVTPAVTWLENDNRSRTVTERVLFAALLLKATALAVREVPEMNGFFTGGEFRPSSAVHVGVAISLRQGGLVAPAIHDVDSLSLVAIMARLRDLVGRARAGTLRSSEMSDPTLTVTNLGDQQGITNVFGVIYPPQVALVGFGAPTPRPWAQGTMLGVRTVLTMTLAADHRVSDGHRGAVFLGALARIIGEPEKL